MDHSGRGEGKRERAMPDVRWPNRTTKLLTTGDQHTPPRVLRISTSRVCGTRPWRHHSLLQERKTGTAFGKDQLRTTALGHPRLPRRSGDTGGVVQAGWGEGWGGSGRSSQPPQAASRNRERGIHSQTSACISGWHTSPVMWRQDSSHAGSRDGPSYMRVAARQPGGAHSMQKAEASAECNDIKIEDAVRARPFPKTMMNAWFQISKFENRVFPPRCQSGLRSACED